MILAAPTPIAVKGLHVRRYKNLRDVFVPWSDGMAVFGVNGAGKTNLLECLALLLGTPRTVALASSRLLQPEKDYLAIDVRVDEDHLPMPPDEAFRFTAPLPAEVQGSFPALARAAAGADWWRALGASQGASFSSGLAESRTPDMAGS